MKDRLNNMINAKNLVLVGIVISISLTVFCIELIIFTFTVNSKFDVINNSINAKFGSINNEFKAINQRFDYKEKLEVENEK